MRGLCKADILLCIAISLSYFIFWALAIFISGNGHINFWWNAIIPFSWQVLYVSFINISLHLIAIPFIRSKQIKWVWATALLIVLLLCLTIGFKGWLNLGEILSVYSKPKSRIAGLDEEVKTVLFQIFGLGYFASIKFFVDAYRLKLKNQQLFTEKKISELNYLKSQTNPHFLFNTLNNIYLLARERSPLTADSVLRLSEILRYMLYETEGKLVNADKEIKALEDYIELERLRYDHTLKVKFSVESDDLKQAIPPLLMIPLVENAFKHGVSETVGTKFVHITLVIKNEELHFEVENSKNEYDSTVENQHGIGLKNLRQQLQLLFKDYDLKIENRGNTFYSSMSIKLNSYADN